MNSASEPLLEDPIGAYPPATVACFDPTCGELPRRRLDRPRTIAFLEKLAAERVPAVLIGASTGHGHLRTVDELAEWYAAAAEAQLGETLKFALLRPEDGADANDRLLDRLVEWGYACVFVRPGTDLPDYAGDAEVAANMAPLVAAAARRGLAVGVYSISDVSGVPLSAAAAALLAQGEGGRSIVAAKVTEADYNASTLKFLEHPALRRWKIVQGWDPHLAQAMNDGPAYDDRGRQRCGVTSGPMSLAVYQYQHIFSAAALELWSELRESQQSVTALFTAMQDDPRRFADLQRAKWIMGLGQPLLSTVSAEQAERVLAALAALPRADDRHRLARSLDLMGDGPYHARLVELSLVG